MTFEQWYESEFHKPPDFNGRYFRSAWEAGRRQALLEAAEAIQLTAIKTLSPPSDTADITLVEAIWAAIRNL
jgi:hypothetical protein